jgi:hypothetical protein
LTLQNNLGKFFCYLKKEYGGEMDKLNEYAAIDPMAMILHGKAYLIWLEIHHPHVPSVAEIEQVLKRMTKVERNLSVARAKTLVAYGKAVEEAAAKVK